MIAIRCQCCGGEFAGCTRDKYCLFCRPSYEVRVGMFLEWCWWAFKIGAALGLMYGAALLIVEVIQ